MSQFQLREGLFFEVQGMKFNLNESRPAVSALLDLTSISRYKIFRLLRGEFKGKLECLYDQLLTCTGGYSLDLGL